MKDLAMAYAIKKNAKKMSSGGVVPEAEKKAGLVASILSKKGSNQIMPVTEGTEHDDFLSAEDDMSDMDFEEENMNPVEAGEVEGMGQSRKSLLSKILSGSK